MTACSTTSTASTSPQTHALRGASTPPPPARWPEGNVGGGTGMIAYEFKGGTGTASRRLAIGGARLHGRRARAGQSRPAPLADHLRRAGRPRASRDGRLPGRARARLDHRRARHRRAADPRASSSASPAAPRSASAAAARPAATTPATSSSPSRPPTRWTCLRPPGPWRSLTWLNDELLDPVYLAAVEAVDEAVLNALLSAKDVPTARPAGAICAAINPDRLLAAVSR